MRMEVLSLVLHSNKSGRVAQVVEQCPFKAWVAGSNPAALTNFQSLAGDGNRFRSNTYSTTLQKTPLRRDHFISHDAGVPV
jgi:hypothetical protein